MPPGGCSPARVWRVTTRRRVLAVKVLTRRPGVVDGYDIPAFLQKPEQIKRVHRELPGLSPFYVDVLGVWEQSTWAAYAMPFVDGAAAVSPQSPPERAADRLGHVFGVLTEHGYARTRGSAGDGQLRSLHLGRIRRRLWVLERHLRPELLDGPPLLVNGRSCRPLGPLMQEVESNAALNRLLRPAVVSYPVHGDLDLGDVLVAADRPDAFTVIDPHGTRGYRDPVYDFAKALFSMTVLDRSTASGLRIWRSPDRPGRPTSYLVRAVDPYRHYPALAASFVDMLGALPFGKELSRVDPHWRVRLAFAHGFHSLAEASWRLADRSPRSATAAAAARDPATLATGFCALGLRLLEQAIAGAREAAAALPDVSTGLDDDAVVAWRA
jgi:hypothetical protein